MSTVLVVVLEGRRVGELIRDRTDRLRLRLDETYAADTSATPLSVSLPAPRREHGHGGVEPWLWGLLPDNADVLARWGRAFGVSVASPFPLLGTPVGLDCAGAVQFSAPEQLDEVAGRSGAVEWLSEAELAARLRALRADSTSWLGPGATGQFSLAGAQAKTALHHADGRWGAPTGSLPTTHIIKPAVAGLEALDLNEHLCMTVARDLGLRAANTSLVRFEEQTAIAVERYDRAHGDDMVIRVHQEDLCQALGVHPGRKYQAEGGPGPGEVAELLRSVIPGPATTTDLWRFVDALIFNWLIAGTDAHAKNYSLLLSGPQARLAPLYDVASYLPYDTSKGHRVKLAMKIGDDYRLPRADRPSAWVHAARDLGVDHEQLVARIGDLLGRVTDAFADAANSPEVAALGHPLPHRLSDLIAERVRHLRRLGHP